MSKKERSGRNLQFYAEETGKTVHIFNGFVSVILTVRAAQKFLILIKKYRFCFEINDFLTRRFSESERKNKLEVTKNLERMKKLQFFVPKLEKVVGIGKSAQDYMSNSSEFCP